jgi:hypothetical protein
MKSYPIWNKIKSDSYKIRSKKFGAKNNFEQEIFVGSSKSNSHWLGNIQVDRIIEEDQISFNFYIDDKLYKKLTFTNEKDRPGLLTGIYKYDINKNG